MPPRRLDRIIYSATGAAHPDHVARHSWLRDQILKRGINIARPFLRLNLRCFLRRQLIKSIATALAISAVVQREHVDSRCRKLLRQAVPNLALPIALMQKQHTRPRLRRSKISRLKLSAVTRGQIDGPLSRPRTYAKAKSAQQKGKNATRKTTHNGLLLHRQHHIEP